MPDQRETAWLLVPPLIWEKITRQLQWLREPRQKKERKPGVATPIPDVLLPAVDDAIAGGATEYIVTVS